MNVVRDFGTAATALATALGAAGCADDLPVDARSFEAADRLFHADERFLGGDGAFSVPLDQDRTLWLFGDTFVARAQGSTRRSAALVRNAVAIQRGNDPTAAGFELHVRYVDGEPAPIFPDDGDAWFWPVHGIRLVEGPLVLFLARQVASDDGLGFRADGYRIARIDDPDAEPRTWSITWLDPPPTPGDRDATVGVAVVGDGEHLHAFANAEGDSHVGWLARFEVAELLAGKADPAWFTDGAYVRAGDLDDGAPETVIDDVGPECSVHFEPRWNRYVHVASVGFGDTSIAMRTAPAIHGPWSDPVVVFTPPESEGDDPFVYAAKAHPALVGTSSRDLLVTYATNSFDFERLLDDPTLYFPRFVALELDSW